MKKFLTAFSALFLLISTAYSQSSLIIIDSSEYGIRNLNTFKINGTPLKQVFIQQNTIQGSQGSTGGNYYKLNDPKNAWNPVNFLQAPCCPAGNCYPVDHVVQSRTNPQIMIFNGIYVCGSDSGDYNKITYDGGATVIDLPFGGGNSGQQCRGFDIDPADDQVMYFAHTRFNGITYSEPLIFKSTNGGTNWFVTDTLSGMKKIGSPWITGSPWGGFLKVCPWNPQIIMTVTGDNLAYSINGGNDFIVRNEVPFIKILVYDEGDQWIHGVSLDNKIYCNQGNPLGNWLPLQAGFDIKFIEVNPDDHNFWYGGSDHGVYRSTNWGLQWSFYNNSFSPSDKIVGIAKDSLSGDTIIVATEKRVYKVWQSLIVNISSPGEFVQDYSLSQNYPNPFNPVTNIKFQIPDAGFVTLKVFDIAGKEIQALVNGNLQPGAYSVNFNAAGLPSGMYFYELSASGGAGKFRDTKKMVLVK